MYICRRFTHSKWRKGITGTKSKTQFHWNKF